MSRVHDALRRAEQVGQPRSPEPPRSASVSTALSNASTLAAEPEGLDTTTGSLSLNREFLSRVKTVPFQPSPDSHLIDIAKPNEAPAEEFRSLRTRLNHLKTSQPVYSVVVTSPSPAEGKSFAAANLALTEAQLEDNPTLLVDCDFRRPVMHNLFQLERGPGLTTYLMGKAPLEDCIKRIAGSNLYVLPAGEAVINPLELLNLREMAVLINELQRVFNWVLLDSPPLLFAADANLLGTLCSGTVLVVRIGTTTIDSVTRAMQSLCENNVLGIIVNGARRGELYSKYTYYHSYYYYTKPEEAAAVEEPAVKAGA